MTASSDTIWHSASDAIVRGDNVALDALLRDHRDALRQPPPRGSWWGNVSAGDARAIITRAHFFDSWDDYAAFRETLRDTASPIAAFETAVDAIVSGDRATLSRLLREQPALVSMRSARTHRAMLIHYVGANGVEGYRQRTPPNIVEIAGLLLDAGAEINASADMYGGADTLGLVATSVHPVIAGVQLPLMEYLLARGASLETTSGGSKSSGIVNACFANGRPAAAELLAARGAPLDLEAAAGLGRLDLVRTYVSDEGALMNGATEQQRLDGFSWASAYGRTETIALLLQHGLPIAATLRPHRQTGLHWAAHNGHADTVRLLLAHDSPVDVRDESFDGTPLDWALHGWSGDGPHESGDGYLDIVDQLLRAGARVDPTLVADGEPTTPLAQRVREDARMLALLKSAV